MGGKRRETEESLIKTLTSKQVVKTLAKPGSSFDRSGLLNEVYEALGRRQGKDGQAALAEIMVEALCGKATNATVRQRILDSICRLVNWHSDDIRVRSVEDMSEEELVHAVAAAIPQLRVLAAPVSKRPSSQARYKATYKAKKSAQATRGATQATREQRDALEAAVEPPQEREEWEEFPEDEPHEPFN